jgi:hypothetical protein
VAPRPSPGCAPPVTVRVLGPTWEVVLEVPAIYGNAAGVAARCRVMGLLAQQRRGEVLINANHVPERLL